MHIPDGFLNTRTILTTAAVSAVGVGIALHRIHTELPRRKIPLIGLTAAFVFAAQMLNFPVAAGTSGHLIGAVLSAVLLGPAPAVLVMTSVLVLQCFLFADGGLLALGANVLNMALIAPLAGFAIYEGVRRLVPGERGRLAAVAFASWCSTVLAATFCAAELAWSGTSPWSAVFPAMAGVHMLIGLGEAAISTVVVASIAQARPEILDQREPFHLRRGFFIPGVLIVLALIVLVSPFASKWPDGLERVAQVLGFAHETLDQALWAASVPTILAGLIGTVVVFALSFLFARVLTR
jgi:cobalt/nickel transport system permease protein